MNPVYDVDGITIYHADCADILPGIDPADVGLLLTDPPYGINVDTDTLARTGTKAWPGKRNAPIVGDTEPFNPSHLIRYGRMVLWGANNYAHLLPPSSSWIVWDRDSGNSNTADAELAWTNLGGTVRKFRHLWNGLCRDSEIGHHVHPTQKPVALMRWILDKWTEPGDLILDPYMGSGPIARACADLGRRYIGIEIVEEYVDAAINRLGQTTLDLNQ